MDKKPPLLLVFGFLPVSNGGKNKGGIAYATYHLHRAIGLQEKGSFVTHYIATDYNKKRILADGMIVQGFHSGIILSLIFRSPAIFLQYYIKSRESLFRCGVTRFTALKLFCMFHYYLKKYKPGMVHVHGGLSGVILNRLKVKLPCKKFIRLHGLNTKGHHLKNYNQVINLEKEISTQLWDGFTFLSHENLSEWCTTYSICSKNMMVFNNGFDPVTFNSDVLPLENEEINYKKKIRLLTVGVINENKGQQRVLKAIANSKDPSRFEYCCIGYDPEGITNDMDEFAKKHDISFKFFGYIAQNKLAAYFAQSDYLVQPSVMEGFGMVNLESIACGIPVIVPSEIPIAKEPGLLNESNSVLIHGNDVLSITKVLDNLQKKSFSRNKVSETVKDKTWEVVAINYVEYINKIYFTE